MNALSPDVDRKLATAVERMPAFPRSVQRILELTRSINCLPKDIVAVIEKDPVMTMKIFKLINSAHYNLPNKITSIGQSVVYLGINTIKNLALGFAAAGILPRMNVDGFDVQRYLLHSLVVAGVARQLGGQFAKDEVDPGDCYVAGLLHDFGKVVSAQFLAAEFHRALEYSSEHSVPLHEAERLVIGVDHGVIGALLAKRWAFSELMVDLIRDHHDSSAPTSAALDCLRVADQVVRYNQIGDSGNPWRDSEPAAAPERFGEDIESLVVQMGSLDRIVAEARMFAQLANEG
ncbi:HDOD domain-containing protein [Sulfuritalea sp.]|uniref:HDOD domain-containing protein n=1 Tax=Sulfuritalea sp. TaxID=2480090 RepID=UPI001ACFFCCB|nr:HDOD domain-containing protein [Sulfuritalea sp.]MBN8474868.1 HDOD domain-containing protein [Sulfuritalea sp.]